MRQMKLFYLARKSIVACKFLNCEVSCKRAISTTNHYFSNLEEEIKDIRISERIQLSTSTVKKFKRPPFVKNLFTGIFDTHLCEFPEILDKSEVVEVEYVVQCINEIYKSKVDSQMIDKEGKIPEDVLQELKGLGLFGRLVPTKYGGLGLNYTSLVRLNEAIGCDWSIFTTLAAHEFLGIQALLEAGNEQQKTKFLPDLASGKRIAALCCVESACGSDLNGIETIASLSSDGKNYLLNGNKLWVTNGDMADVFIVFAKAQEYFSAPEVITAFLVEKDPTTVIVSPPYQKTGLRGTKVCSVDFVNTMVPAENVIGDIGQGNEILLKVLQTCHFGMASCTFGVLKEMLEMATEHIINTVRYGKPMSELALIRKRMAEITVRIYAMESAAYFTAALVDSTENPDFTLEAAILKVFNSEGTHFCLRELMNIMGSSSIMESHPFERFYRDSHALDVFGGTNDVARLSIGLIGCAYVGQKKEEFLRKSRNPYYEPMDFLKTKWRYHRVMQGKFKYKQDIAGHLHPSLIIMGNKLEEYVAKFEILAEYTLTKYGKDIIDDQYSAILLANIAIDLYVMTAILARCSRSYCIGLRNSFQEIRTAVVFCNEATERMQSCFNNLGKYADEYILGHHMKLCENVLDWRGYYPQSPLKHNF